MNNTPVPNFMFLALLIGFMVDITSLLEKFSFVVLIVKLYPFQAFISVTLSVIMVTVIILAVKVMGIKT